jgi:hypothetical protein
VFQTKHLAIPVESKDFAENQDEYHAHEDSRLLHVRAYALKRVNIGTNACVNVCPLDCATYRVTNNANSVACRKTSQAYTQTTAQVQETVEQAVCLLRWRAHVASDQDGNHQGIHRNDTGHDYRDERLNL